MNQQIRWGVLGYAGIAYKHVIPAMQEARNAMPYAIASRSDEKLIEASARFGFTKVYSNYDSLLRDPEVDAVYIPLPNALHKEWTIKAARAGKHVLCEKPLALTEADCLEMITTCKECNVQLMEAFMYRLTARTKKLIELLDSGVIGQVMHVNSTFRFMLEDRENVRVNKSLGGGSLRDVGCYPINIIGMIMKDEPVSFCVEKVSFQGVDKSLSALLRYKNGVICTVSSGFDACSALLTEINGTKGSLLVRDSFGDSDVPILLVKDGVTTEIIIQECKRYVLEVEEFSDALLMGRTPALDLSETVRNNRLIEKILEAAQ